MRVLDKIFYIIIQIVIGFAILIASLTDKYTEAAILIVAFALFEIATRLGDLEGKDAKGDKK